MAHVDFYEDVINGCFQSLQKDAVIQSELNCITRTRLGLSELPPLYFMETNQLWKNMKKQVTKEFLEKVIGKVEEGI